MHIATIARSNVHECIMLDFDMNLTFVNLFGRALANERIPFEIRGKRFTIAKREFILKNELPRDPKLNPYMFKELLMRLNKNQRQEIIRNLKDLNGGDAVFRVLNILEFSKKYAGCLLTVFDTSPEEKLTVSTKNADIISKVVYSRSEKYCEKAVAILPEGGKVLTINHFPKLTDGRNKGVCFLKGTFPPHPGKDLPLYTKKPFKFEDLSPSRDLFCWRNNEINEYHNLFSLPKGFPTRMVHRKDGSIKHFSKHKFSGAIEEHEKYFSIVDKAIEMYKNARLQEVV